MSTVYDIAGENVAEMPRKTSSRATAKVLSSQTIYEGAVFGIRRDEIVEPTGIHATR